MQIISYVEAMANDRDGPVVTERANRFGEFALKSYKNAEKIERAWQTLSNAAQSGIVAVFARLPDKADATPNASRYRERATDPDGDAACYAKLLKHAAGIKEHIAPGANVYMNLLGDALATRGAAIRHFTEFDKARGGFLAGLQALIDLLSTVDPAAKIPTSQWRSPDAALKNYVMQVATLNIHLSKPKHAALAVIANVNYPSGKLSAEALRKSWERSTDKLP